MKKIKEFCESLWSKFTAWKYYQYALWGGVAVIVIAVVLVVALCMAKPNANNPSISGTEPNGTVETLPDGTPVVAPDATTPDGTPATTPNGTANNGGSSNNGGGSSNNGGGSSNNGGANTNDENTNADAPPAPEGTVDQMKNVVSVKTASAGGSITAHPGGRIIYTISITNNNKDAIGVTVTDTLPTGTKLVKGCSTVSGNTLTWKVNSIAAGKTHNIVYTVSPDYTVQQVRDSKADIIIKNTAAKVQENAVAAPGKDIYVLETFNATDRRRIETGINALINANLTAKNSSNQQFNSDVLISQMYTIGFSVSSGVPAPETALSHAFEIAGSTSASSTDRENANKLIDKIVPGLYGGTAVPASKDSLFRGERVSAVTMNDLISGDVIIVSKSGTAKMYIVCNTHLVEVGVSQVVNNIDPATVLPGLTSSEKYVVLRPSINLTAHYSLNDDEYFNDYDKGAYTDLENAIVKTAETYWLRGDRAQYTDDYCGYGIARYELGVNRPEDFTVDRYGYTNCAGFTFDVHWATYGYKAKATMANGNVQYLHGTSYIASSAKKGWNAETLKGDNKSTIYYLEPNSSLTDSQKNAIQQKVYELLRPGDVICIRRTSGYGHAMLYVGNGLIIHSGGGSYSSSTNSDSHEATIRCMAVSELFDPAVNTGNYGKYVFDLANFSIVRPQNLTTPSIPENTTNRINYMAGVIGEKITSTAMGKTVNPGDEITYTFYIFNTNNEAKNFVIKDTLSQHVDFVSVTGEGKNSGSEVSWNFSVPANTRVSVSYTVKVKAGVAAYTAIDGSKATINGVVHKCLNTYVANTLTAEQQQTLINAVNTVKQQGITGMDTIQVANKIYETAFGVDNLFGDAVTNLDELIGNTTQTSARQNVGVFNDTTVYSTAGIVCMMDSNTSKAAMMVAPGMYGGDKVYENNDSEAYKRYQGLGKESLRSKYYWEKDLVVGDLFFMKSSSATYLYIYVGNNKLINLTNMSEYNATEWLQKAPNSSWKYHAILRPSIVWENI